jgi:serine/threonine-protein kinase RsbW
MFSLSWRASIESISDIAEQIQAELIRLGLDSHSLMKINLAIEEITVNIINHAYGDVMRGNIEVSIEKTDSQVIIHIFDEGMPFNPLDAEDPDVNASMAERPIGGLGIFMAKNLVDTITYERRGTRNHLMLINSL